jgi:hypothetical protein
MRRKWCKLIKKHVLTVQIFEVVSDLLNVRNSTCAALIFFSVKASVSLMMMVMMIIKIIEIITVLVHAVYNILNQDIRTKLMKILHSHCIISSYTDV